MSISATDKIMSCETCGERFWASTMHHTDTAPECGDCRNTRLAAYIACGWATADEPSVPCEHDDQFMTREGMYCPDCETVTYDIDAMREDAALAQAEMDREDRFMGE